MTPTRRLRAATIALVVCRLAFHSGPALATCGGGGGGGVGGAKAGGTPPTETAAYRAPWKVLPESDAGPDGPLGVLWFPATDAEAKESDLLTSRTLSVLSARCVSLAIVPPERLALRETYEIPSSGSSIVLVNERNEVIARVVPSGPTVPIGPVETMVQAEVDKRENEAKAALATANEKIKQKDLETATALLTKVWDQRCMFPEAAKKAAKALKKIGHPVNVGTLLGGKDPAFLAMTATANRDAAARR